MIDLPDFCPLVITQSTGKAGRKQTGALDLLIAILPENPAAADFKGLPRAAHLERVLTRSDKAGNASVTTYLDNERATAVTLATFKPKNAFETLTWARKLIAEGARIKASKLGLVVAGLSASDRETVVRALLRAADAAAFALADFKSQGKKKQHPLRSLTLLAAEPKLSIQDLRSGNLGNNIARWLTALPPNKLTVAAYRAAARTLAKQFGMQEEFIDSAKLKRLGAGAFLAVSQGNANSDAGIIHLRYRPSRPASPARSIRSTRSAKPAPPALALVGKGILFDTGGTNLKPFQGMLEMHTDMQGSAVALGTAVELAARKAPFAFDVWLAVTENRISATAYKSQDVVVAVNGTSIQVIHTDAEGRMVLADTLALAAREKPALMIDYATLTGACVSALTTRYSGVFSNRASSARALLGAGMTSGERVWPFPLDEDFDESLASKVADVKQCAVEGAGDHIFATRFLKRFVPDDIAWVHMDLSAGQHKGGLGAIPTDITGFGVAYTLALLSGDDPAALAASWQTD